MEGIERRYVLAALGVVIAVVAVLALVDVVREATASESTRIELVRLCLEEERRFPVFELPATSSLAEARLGGLRTIVEVTNEAEVAIAGSEDEAARLAAEAERRGAGAFVERRFDIVWVWELPPSPTQRQNVIECSY